MRISTDLGGNCIAFTVAFGPVYPQIAESCRSSFHAWHPEVPFLIFSEQEYRELISEGGPQWKGEIISLRIIIGWFLSLFYEKVLYLDADMIILGPLEEMIPESGKTVLTSDVCDIAGATIPGMSKVTSSFIFASGAAFWKIWAWTNYSYLFPIIDYAFIDQLSLRFVEMDSKNQCSIFPEGERHCYYNTSLLVVEGEWRVEGDKVYKGGARGMIYHSAASKHRGVGSLPEEVRPFAESLIERGKEPGLGVDFKSFCAMKKQRFHDQVFTLFREMPTLWLEEPFNFVHAENPFEWACVAPAFFDQVRPSSRHFNRRLDPKLGVFVYTMS